MYLAHYSKPLTHRTPALGLAQPCTASHQPRFNHPSPTPTDNHPLFKMPQTRSTGTATCSGAAYKAPTPRRRLKALANVPHHLAAPPCSEKRRRWLPIPAPAGRRRLRALTNVPRHPLTPMPSPQRRRRQPIPALARHQARGKVGAKQLSGMYIPLSHLEGNHTVLRRKTSGMQAQQDATASHPEKTHQVSFFSFFFIHGTTYNYSTGRPECLNTAASQLPPRTPPCREGEASCRPGPPLSLRVGASIVPDTPPITLDINKAGKKTSEGNCKNHNAGGSSKRPQ